MLEIIEKIAGEVGVKHKMSAKEMLGQSQTARIMRAREELYYRLSRETALSYVKISKELNLGSHSTVSYGVRSYIQRHSPEASIPVSIVAASMDGYLDEFKTFMSGWLESFKVALESARGSNENDANEPDFGVSHTCGYPLTWEGSVLCLEPTLPGMRCMQHNNTLVKTEGQCAFRLDSDLCENDAMPGNLYCAKCIPMMFSNRVCCFIQRGCKNMALPGKEFCESCAPPGAPPIVREPKTRKPRL